MDEQNQDNNSDVVFNVMPNQGKPTEGSVPSMGSAAPSSAQVSGGGRKWIYIVVAIIVLLGLGGGAYYLLGMKKDPVATPSTNTSKLSKAFLNKYFNTEACATPTTCGDAADPDMDALSNYDEFKAGTNPLNPDTDADGLADGDEVNIYKTDPTLKYTDRREIVATNDWSDGFQIKNGFDPLTPALALTAVRKQQIADATLQFKLHEPTITTLGAQQQSSSSADTKDWKTYVNTQYGFEFKYPPVYVLFGGVDSKDKPIAVSGSSTLVSVTDKFLAGGEMEQFSVSIDKSNTPAKASLEKNTNYTNIQQIDFEGIKVWELNGTASIDSPDKIIAFNKNNLLYTITLSSAEKGKFEQILSTFKFTK